MVNDEPPTRFRFNGFLLDVANRRLLSGDDFVHLEPKSFDVLQFLVEHADHLVTKEQIVEAVWAHAFVSDNSLTRCIHQIRGALEDDADDPRFIETVAGSGYRFVAAVEAVADQADTPANEPDKEDPSWPRNGFVALAITILVVIAVLWANTSKDIPKVERIAVLPLVNLTGDESQEYFVQGVHDALIAELSRAVSVDVISRTSVMAFDGTELPMSRIAARLDVDAVIEGSVLRAGDNLTVTAQLIAMDPERHLWADRYHRNVNELFEITTDIVAAIAAEIALEITPADRPPAQPMADVEQAAYEAYLLARFHFQQRSPEGYRLARQHYQRAIELDPEFAPPYAGLAHNFGSAAIFGQVRPADGFTEAYRLAKEAVRLDDNLAEGQRILAGIEFYWKWNWEEAERLADRALQLDPNSAGAHRFLAEVYSATGRHDQAFSAIEHGRGIDPLPPISQFKPSLILYLNRDFELATQRSRAALEYYPTYWQGHWLLCLSLAASGDTDEAIGACSSAAELSGDTPMALGALGYVLALGGDRTEALRIAGELDRRSQSAYVGPANLAMIYGALGETERAFDFLERAYSVRDQQLVHAHHAALFDTLRDDPRFEALRSAAFSDDVVANQKITKR